MDTAAPTPASAGAAPKLRLLNQRADRLHLQPGDARKLMFAGAALIVASLLIATIGTYLVCWNSYACNGHRCQRGVFASRGLLSFSYRLVQPWTYACRCHAGFGGAHCEFNHTVQCNGRGESDDSGSCTCQSGFTGPRCDQCQPNHFGSECVFCTASDTCKGHGRCSTLGTCTCDRGFDGANCQQCSDKLLVWPMCATLVAGNSLSLSVNDVSVTHLGSPYVLRLLLTNAGAQTLPSGARLELHSPAGSCVRSPHVLHVLASVSAKSQVPLHATVSCDHVAPTELTVPSHFVFYLFAADGQPLLRHEVSIPFTIYVRPTMLRLAAQQRRSMDHPYRIVLLGIQGSSKSSFLNALHWGVQGSFAARRAVRQPLAIVGVATDPTTLYVQEYAFNTSATAGVPFVFVDTPGMSDKFPITRKNILERILRGTYPKFNKDDYTKSYMPTEPPPKVESARRPWVRSKADLVMLFVTQGAVEHIKNDYAAISSTCTQLGVPLTLVLSQADGLERSLLVDSITRTAGLQNLYAKLTAATGSISSRVTHLVTYRDGLTPDFNLDRSTFHVMRHALAHLTANTDDVHAAHPHSDVDGRTDAQRFGALLPIGTPLLLTIALAVVAAACARAFSSMRVRPVPAGNSPVAIGVPSESAGGAPQEEEEMETPAPPSQSLRSSMRNQSHARAVAPPENLTDADF